MTRQEVFICLCLIASTILFAEAKPLQSPAGGGWLQLDTKHDFVATVKAWFPNEEFEELTVEAWIYIEELPVAGAFWSIIGQEGRFNLIIHGNGGGALGAWGYAEGAKAGLSISPGQLLPKREWSHVVALYDAGTGQGLNGRGGNWCCPGGHLIKSDKPLHIGGVIAQDLERSHFVGDNMKFRGYIDEVRISDVVRYVKPKWNVPKGRFTVDEHTISLWHFDEAPRASRFKEASGHSYNLWRNGVLPVTTQGKLATTWGRLKR